MAYILASTDFSEIGNNAVDYAAQLALSLNLQLSIVNFYSMPITFGEVPVPDMTFDKTEEMSEEAMSLLVNGLLKSYPSLVVNYQVIYDDVLEGLTNYASQHGVPMLVVVGNALTGDDFTFIESVLVRSFKHLRFPVLAIPPDTTFKPVTSLCFAFDNKNKNNEVAITELKTITMALGAKLYIIHVEEDAMSRDNLVDVSDEVKAMLAEVDPVYHYEYDVVVEDAIEVFASKNHINWQVVLPRSYSFFESLFHRSHSKSLAHQMLIPLLVLHEH